MRYEIINPSDRCFIRAEDVRLAQVAVAYLGRGMYGLADENGESVYHIFADLQNTLKMTEEETVSFITAHWNELAEVFESFEYASERTSLNNIGAKAERLAKFAREKAKSEKRRQKKKARAET